MALLGGAEGIILAHNHTTGDPSPSKDDIKVLKDIKRSGKTLGIQSHIDLYDRPVIVSLNNIKALCERNLRIYAESFSASQYHYQDYANKEIDAVIENSEGEWFAFLKICFPLS